MNSQINDEKLKLLNAIRLHFADVKTSRIHDECYLSSDEKQFLFDIDWVRFLTGESDYLLHPRIHKDANIDFQLLHELRGENYRYYLPSLMYVVLNNNNKLENVHVMSVQEVVLYVLLKNNKVSDLNLNKKLAVIFFDRNNTLTIDQKKIVACFLSFISNISCSYHPVFAITPDVVLESYWSKFL